VLLEDGAIGQIRRWQVLGTVADLPARREAQTLLDERLRAINAGASRPEALISFGNFGEHQWKTLVLPTFKASTQHGYKTVLNAHVLPAWRDWRLRDIERLAIQRWVADKFRQGTGWQTVRNAWVLLSGILETAVEYGYLQANPARGVKFPQKGRKEKPAIIAGEDFVRLLKHLNEPYRTMVRLIAATGLRIGELLALRWSALDLELASLAVRESVFEGKFQLPKTLTATRTIPLGRHAVATLKAHRERANRTAPDDLVFGNRGGKPLRESKLLRNVLQPAGERAGVGRVKWHQFRHIHSSLLNDLKARQDCPRAARTRERLDHAQHLHAHRCLASQGCRGPRRAVVWRDGLFWTEVAGNGGSGLSRKWGFSLGL
jgi:integrase